MMSRSYKMSFRSGASALYCSGLDEQAVRISDLEEYARRGWPFSSGAKARILKLFRGKDDAAEVEPGARGLERRASV